MLTALLNVTETQIGKPIEFWADKLAMSEGEVSALFDNLPTIKNMIRKKLMKRGGVGYVQPGPDTFPNVDDVHKLILSAGALPCITWLDGTSDGEQDIEELLDLLIEKGAAALNIVPDRNWNIADSEIKALKVENLYHIVDLAQKLDLPLNVGTEMNSFGLKFVDSFDVEELAPVKEAFMDGAYFIYGHTIMQRFADLGYQSDWAKGNFATRGEKNQFYTTIGKAVEPENARQALSGINDKHTPVTILNLISQLP